MPINIDLLIAAPILQDALVDKDGTPMSAGVITCYHDNSRTTLKNWYYQSSNFADAEGFYTYSKLPNPLTLSAAGTICDINGVDTIPFFYPYSEIDENESDPYYITIVNHEQTNQITRPNFPFLPPNSNSGNVINSYNNLIINNGFWRNLAPNTLNVTPFTTVTLQDEVTENVDGNFGVIVAPSQHDGFKLPDTQFIKTDDTGTDVLTFVPFPLGNAQPINTYIVPEYYISHVCSDTGSTQTQKCYQFPISLHVNTLANVTYTVSIQAQNVGGTGIGQNVITLFLLQDTGTGTTSPAPMEIGQITLNSSWKSYAFTAVFPSTSGLILGKGADDGLYLQVQMPLNMTCSINFTKPSIFLTSDIVPNNDFQTYDQVDTVINSPRTGDVRVSLNSFYSYGWVPMNGGTLCNNGSITPPTNNGFARQNTDAWQLFNLLWNSFKPFDNGGINVLAQMYSSAGSTTSYGATAIADWTALKQLQLTRSMGQVILGTVPITALIPPYLTTFTASNSGGNLLLTTPNFNAFFNGMPFYVSNTGGSLPGGLSAGVIYYVAAFNGLSTFLVSTTFVNAMAGTYIAYSSTGSGTNTITSALAGSYEGEQAHTQLLAELAAHAHTVPLGSVEVDVQAGSLGIEGVTAGPTATSSTGSPTAFNVTQQGAFYNLFMKL